jgi:hypothetical protein
MQELKPRARGLCLELDCLSMGRPVGYPVSLLAGGTSRLQEGVFPRMLSNMLAP